MLRALRAFDKSEDGVRRFFEHFGPGSDATGRYRAIAAPLPLAEFAEGRSRSDDVHYWFCTQKRGWFGRYEVLCDFQKLLSCYHVCCSVISIPAFSTLILKNSALMSSKWLIACGQAIQISDPA